MRPDIATVLVGLPLVLACSPPRQPPTSGPVGASGTCWAGVDEPGSAGVDDDVFQDSASGVAFIIERGTLRELSVSIPDSPLTGLIRWNPRPPVAGLERAKMMRGRARNLDIPLEVGQWATAQVGLRSNGAREPSRTIPVRLRVLGDRTEVELGGAAASGRCVWGRVDRDALSESAEP